MKEDFLEGNFACEPDRHHDHSCDPKEEDVVASFEHLVGEEGFDIGVFSVRPLQR